MNIKFKARTNKDYVMVNTAVFALKSGIQVTLDRDLTYYSITAGILEMEWCDCYLWGINGEEVFLAPAYLNESALPLFEDAKLIALNLEDDADSDYEIADIRFCIN